MHTVLFPGGPLPLRIFEQRYIDMVRDAIKDESGIGICLISDGSEVGGADSQ
ncbi:LON peptidase substrate-binding domain-containing protein [Solemya pervernicosa gill symbiont]|uniref:LON peptidase substrate-binding domain-containing protein n=1 Tax=Solemya pervernicosa gill symbiont TaxID=642797 RepID=UPI0010832193